jgi:hypothetical protein
VLEFCKELCLIYGNEFFSFQTACDMQMPAFYIFKGRYSKRNAVKLHKLLPNAKYLGH